jgi:hypothetical protein
MRFKNNLGFAKSVTNDYDDRFEKIGDTFNLRVPVKFVANDGADITSQIQDVTENKVALTINKQKNAAFQFTSKDLTLTVDRFAERYLDSAAVALANQFESDGLTMAVNTTANLVGTPGTTPNTALVALQAGQKLDEHAAPMDGERYLVINPAAQATMVDALKGLFQDSTEIKSQYRKGRMGTALGFDWAMAQNIPTHTVGTWGTTPLVDGASQTGSTLNVKGLTATTGTITAGDVFTLAGVNDVNPVTGANLGYLKQFVATATATADGSGNAAVSIYPSITTTGAYKTATASPADGAAIVKVGTASTGYAQNLAFHKHAFCFAMVPLQVPQGVHFGKTSIDKDSGLSIRMVSAYNVLTDVFVTRCDILYGWAARRPEFACRITA